MQRVWKSRTYDRDAVEELSRAAGLSVLTARLLHQRGIRTAEEANAFLHPERTPIPDPFLFSEMEAAVARIQQAAKNSERVIVHGDYDVDGITSTAIMLEILWELGIEADYYLPNRLTDSYGLQVESVRRFAEEGYSLVITVDCGTTAVDAVREANSLGIDVIITDHHDPGDERPPATAVINPIRTEETYPEKCLSGAGVAWKTACALRKALMDDDDDEAQLELAALGMVADVMPLTGENRLLLTRALPRFRHCDRPGLSALIDVSGLKANQITATDIGFRLGPRLNAAGRMEDPALALELLLTEDEDRARELAQQLQALNQERQASERKLFNEACRAIERDGLLNESERVLVVSGRDWPRGVIGLTASKLSKRYGRSAFVLTLENGEAHGSARALEGCNLISLLDYARDKAISCGGHEAAAGMRVSEDNLEAFKHALYEAAERFSLEAEKPPVWVDAPLPLERIDDALMSELARLEPFGQQNEAPVFYAAARINGYGARIVGNDHLQVSLSHPRGSIQAIGFGQGGKLESLGNGEVEALFHCRYDEYQGRRDIRLHLVDIRKARNGAAPEVTASPAPPERNVSSQPAEVNQAAAPVVKPVPARPAGPIVSNLDRERLGDVYRLLKKCADEDNRIRRQNASLLAKMQKISVQDFDLAVTIFAELDLLALTPDEMLLHDPKEKRDLNQSPTFNSIQSPGAQP
ncbi:MAG: single-stranded-DNA-specific exonuclease RecJ [bacterium]|nr:single-stranded-DNA-specific exonuclease RecJ [bacterium]